MASSGIRYIAQIPQAARNTVAMMTRYLFRTDAWMIRPSTAYRPFPFSAGAGGEAAVPP